MEQHLLWKNTLYWTTTTDILTEHFQLLGLGPLEIQEGVAVGPILLYISLAYLEFKLSCEKTGQKFQILSKNSRFQNL